MKYIVILQAFIVFNHKDLYYKSPFGTEVFFNYKHNDENLVSTSAVSDNLTGADIGSYPFWCLGDLSSCHNGFTISTWLKTSPLAIISLPVIILSNGGHLVHSNGFYIKRSWGVQFEIGVSHEDRNWKATVQLEVGTWTQLAFTWANKDGLKLYVDGFLKRSDTSGSHRAFQLNLFDVTNVVRVGGWSNADGTVPHLSCDVANVNVTNRILSKQDIQQLVDDEDKLYLGCQRGLLPSETTHVLIPRQYDYIDYCRQKCDKSSDRISRVLHAHRMCSCVKSIHNQPELTRLVANKCSGDTDWQIHYSSHMVIEQNESVTIERTTPDVTVVPGQDVWFTVRTTPHLNNQIRVEVDFNDGTKIDIYSGSTSYSWSMSGTYKVKATVMFGALIGNDETEVKVVDPVLYTKPEFVGIWGSHENRSKSLKLKVSVVAKLTTDCKLRFGDSSDAITKKLFGYIEGLDSRHKYALPGQYNARVACNNSIGQVEAASRILSRQLELNDIVHFLGSDITVNMTGDNDFKQSLKLHIANKHNIDILLVTNNSSITMVSENFNKINMYIASVLDKSGKAVTRYVIDSHVLLRKPQIILNRLTGVKGTVVASQFILHPGARMNVIIEYDMNKVDYTYYMSQRTAITMSRVVKFHKLGYFPVSIEVSNDVSHFKIKQIISIEEPIAKIAVTAVNGSILSAPVPFTIDINPTGSIALRVKISTNYGDGTVETTTHDNSAVDHFTVKIFHSYRYYGVFTVHIEASNAISSNTFSLPVMVGEGISGLKLSRSADRIISDDFVTYMIDYKSGINVTFNVDFGDGYSLNMPEMAFEIEMKHFYVESETTNLLLTANKINNRLVYSTSDDTFVLELNKPKKLTIRHKLIKVGQFPLTVIVSNVFNSVTKKYCPALIVARKVQNTQCLIPSVTFPSNNFTFFKSESFVLKPRVYMSCPEKATYTVTFSRIVDPELALEERYPDVCILQEIGNSVTVPALSLPYGWLRAYVTVSPYGDDMKYTTVTADLQVLESDIVAKFGGTKKLDVYLFGWTIIDMTPSYHPDILNKGKSGLNYDLFCAATDYKEDLDDIYDPRINVTADLVIASTLYQNSSNNPVRFYDIGGCFDKRHVDLVVTDSKLTLATSDFSSKTDTFYLRLFVSRGKQISEDDQMIYVRSSNDSREYDQLDDLLASGDVETVLKIVNVLNRGLNSGETPSNSKAKRDKKEKRTKLINVIGKMAANITDTDTIGETVNALAGITQTKAEVSQESRKAATDAVAHITKATERIGNDIPLEKAVGVGLGIMATLSNLYPDEKQESIFLVKNHEKKIEKSHIDTSGQDETGTLKESQEQNKDDNANEDDEEEENEDKIIEGVLKEIVGTDNPSWNTTTYRNLIRFYYPGDINEFKVLVDDNHPDDLKDFLLERLKDEEIQEKIDEKDADKQVATLGTRAISGLANLALSKISENGSVSLNSTKLELKVSKLNLNDSETNGGLYDPDAGFDLPMSAFMNATNGNIGVQMSKSKVNQFTWEEGSEAITGGTFSLSLASETGGEVPVTNTGVESPISFWLYSSSQEKKTKKTYTVHQSSKRININYHFINHSNTELSMRATIHPLGDFTLTVYLVHNGFPNDTHFDYKEKIPKDESDYLGYNATERDHLIHTIVVPSHLTQRAGVYRLGIATHGTVNHSYTFQFFETGCKYRDVVNKKWSGDGCRVGELSTAESTNCLCTHLTSFGGNFVVPPNTIDFNTVWAKFKDLNENAAVFGTVVAILGLYVVLIIWSRRMDKRDVTKWGAIPLEDNLPSDTYHYQISVHTGTKKTATTKSKISFVISGDESDSGVRRLCDGKRKELTRGSILNYVLSVETSLGSLSFLRIWHDNSGKGKLKSWFFEQMAVVDLQTNEKYIFLCDRWLAVEEDDGQIERIIPVAGINDLINFKHLFSTSVRKKLSNDHLWFSVLSRPTRSNFTRVQRLSCCLSLLFLTMITNAMWFKSEENVEHATVLRIGPFAFTLEQVFISFMGTLIVFPPSFLLITLFRRCRSKKNNVLQSNQTMPKQSQKYKWKTISNSGLWSGPEKSKADKFKDTMTRILDFHRGKLSNRAGDELERNDMEQTGKKTKAKKGWSLPHWMLYFAWFLCFLSVIVPAFFTILYSMEWGAEKANEWLITFVMSFFESVIVVQPIKVLCLVAFLACVLKKPDLGDDDTVDEEATNDISHDEELVSKTTADLNAIMLQRKRACDELRPPDHESLEAARHLRMQELKMESIIKEIIIYGLFLVVLFFISYQTRDDDSFLVAQNLKNIFTSNDGHGLSFKTVTTIPDYWKWLHTLLLPSLFASSHFNNSRLKWWDKNCISDLASRRVGVARLRQMRVKDDTCYIHSSFDTIINHCRSGYSWTADDTKTYYKGWRKEPLHKNESLAKQRFSPWDYQNSLQLKNAPYYGNVAMYKGGGYTYVFRRSLSATTRELQRLQRKNWIDLRTRAVFLEFTLYNPNVNLFSSIIMLVEFVSTGSSFTRTEFKVFRLYSYIGAFGIIVILVETIYVCFTTYFLVHAIKKIKRERLAYFKNFWSVLEFSLLLCSLIAIIMYAIKHVISNYTLSALKQSSSGAFVNFQSLSLYDEFYAYIVGTVVFLSTIQFLKLLQFNKRMNMLGDTIKLSFKDLKIFSITFLIYFLAFGMLAYLLFGTTLASYGNFTNTLESLFAFALGDFDFHAMHDTQRILGPLFFFMYVAIVYIGLMGIFLTIIYEAFAQIKSNVDMQGNDHEIVDFIWTRLKGLLGVK